VGCRTWSSMGQGHCSVASKQVMCVSGLVQPVAPHLCLLKLLLLVAVAADVAAAAGAVCLQARMGCGTMPMSMKS
jgi:hypothetical protein